MKFLKSISSEKLFKIILIVYILFAVGASIQSYLQTNHEYPEYTCYNNYVIFKQSHFHLIDNIDLYINHYQEHGDLFKYSPTFSLLFGAFAYLPTILGLSLWNIFNCLVFFAAIYLLPNIDNRKKIFILLFCLIELMTSMQNEQSNALTAGLIILGFTFLERKNYAIATLLIMASVYIKIFGIVAFALYLLYPKKGKLASYSIIWAIILFTLPLIVVDYSDLKLQYLSWWNMLQNDHSNSLGLSVMGFIDSWFGVSVNKMATVVVGALLFCIPLIQIKKYSIYLFRVLLLCSILIWVIIFNHKAESSTFIIAMAGIAIWFFMSEKNIQNTILVIAAFILVSISPTDLFPKSLRNNIIVPYVLKAVPCILIWLKILYDMFMINQKNLIIEIKEG